MMMHAAHELGTENLLVVPGAVHIPWLKDHDPVPNDVCAAHLNLLMREMSGW